MSISLALNAIASRIRAIAGINSKKKILKDYSYLSEPIQPRNKNHPTPGERSITWILTPFYAGSGGHTTILRFIRSLSAQGFRSQVVVMSGEYFGGVLHFEKLLHKYLEGCNVPVYVDLAECPVSCATVATGWLTAYLLKNYRADTKAVYFIQDYEPWFYPHGTEYELARNTYTFDFFGITAGTWLKQVMETDHHMKCSAFSFSYDERIYFPGEGVDRPEKTVFFYARPATSRRAFEMGVLVLSEVARRSPGTRVVFAGENLSGYEIPFPHISMGLLTPVGLANLYRQSDVALVLSFSNVSLLPLEIMACGTAVVSNGGPWVEWLLSSASCCIANANVGSLVDEICALLNNDARRVELAARGQQFARSTSWDLEANKVARSFDELLSA